MENSIPGDIPEDQLWSWVDRNDPILEEHLAKHPEDFDRVQAIRDAIRAIGSDGGQIKIPEKIGGYRILRFLGSGGMGIVYEAEQPNPRRRVALKVLHRGVLGNENALRLFAREAEALAKLRHPGITAVYEASQTEAGEPFLVMELVEGRPLGEFLLEKKLALREELDLFQKICAAVHYAHEQGVVHRDLKPGNILVDAKGNPRALDFGLAKLRDQNHSWLREHTRAMGPMGTVPYMSPEQVRGTSARVDPRSDVYSLGVTFFEALTGKLPYDLSKGSLPELSRIICESEPTPAGSVRKELKGDIEIILNKALEKDPDQRYASAQELGEEFKRVNAGLPIRACPPTLLYRVRKFASRNRISLLATVAGLGLVFVAWKVFWPSTILQPAIFSELTGENRDRQRAPFPEIRWRDSIPEVFHQGRWNEWIAIEGIRSDLIVAFCKQTAGELWQKRLEEDLVEVLEKMQGREPGDTVRIDLKDLETGKTLVLANQPMTRENRQTLMGRRNRFRQSPFSAVRWKGSAPEVRIGEGWWELLEIEGLPVSQIQAFCQERFQEHWKKRFSEDLAEILLPMGKTVGQSATLRLRSLTTGETQVRAEPLTFENREKIKKFNSEREASSD